MSLIHCFDAKCIKRGMTTSISSSISILIFKADRETHLKSHPGRSHPQCQVPTAERGAVFLARAGLVMGTGRADCVVLIYDLSFFTNTGPYPQGLKI